MRANRCSCWQTSRASRFRELSKRSWRKALSSGLFSAPHSTFRSSPRLLLHYIAAAFGSFALAVTITAVFAAGLVGILALPIAEVMIAYAPGSVDAMMLLALALHLDPVYVGAHHLTRIFYVSMTMPLVARRNARRLNPPDDAPKPPPMRPPFAD